MSLPTELNGRRSVAGSQAVDCFARMYRAALTPGGETTPAAFARVAEAATALAKAIKKTGRTPELYIEINIAAEPQKAGIAPENLAEFLHGCRTTHGLTITGLMCIPPAEADPTPYFQTLKHLADIHALPHISLGMSADFEKAIACGATEIRLGTALFGPRPFPE